MLFLTHLRELSWIHLPSGKVGTARRLTERKTSKTIPWRRSGKDLSIRKTELRDRAGALDWIRYDVEVPVPKKLKRAFKATGDTTTVSVAVPNEGEDQRLVRRPTDQDFSCPSLRDWCRV